ncbi:hypothetical protein GCM10010912_10670 [Paenibacillus albidus]|uniref:Uncharacterized protein n=1 Tax=Paenibacillus albidus TaxID=2041023 RepID=A0A917C4D1_9BACL|nr:hypothetical protein [Paenibacillus albidus]GGF67537.1 hypothetical protein GCM10010912_10670 [Paenibacillus albidus]
MKKRLSIPAALLVIVMLVGQLGLYSSPVKAAPDSGGAVVTETKSSHRANRHDREPFRVSVWIGFSDRLVVGGG